MHSSPQNPIIEGLILTGLNSPYLTEHPKSTRFKSKRDPYTVDAVLMYA